MRPLKAVLILIAMIGTNALAGPKVLSDVEMNEITAGTAGDNPHPVEVATGGSITANESTAEQVDAANVRLDTQAQSGTRSFNLVNAADGLIASGINLWNGASMDLNAGSAINVLQSNELVQYATPQFATLLRYHRGSGTLRDVATWADTTPFEDKIDFDLVLDIPALGSFHAGVEVPSVVIPSAKIPTAFGNAVGFAGEVDIDYDGGWFDAGFDLDASVNFATHFHSESSSEILWGLIDLGGSEITSNTSASATIKPYISLYWDMPDFQAHGEGAVCFANGGECRSGVLDRDIAALHLDAALAEHIVVDRSALGVVETFGVELGAEAQADARAINLANLAGGLVANGVNIATVNDAPDLLGTDEPGNTQTLATEQLLLEQDNSIQQATQDMDQGPDLLKAKRNGPPDDRDGNPGGVIVAYESQATLTSGRSVHAGSAAQAGARAISLVNAADALVANGANVWDGRVQDSVIADRMDITQVNELTQNGGTTSAKLDHYERGSETLYTADTYVKSSAQPKSLGTTVDLTIGATDDPIATLTGGLQVPASIIPTSKIPGIGGTAAGFAGNVDLAIDGGSAEFGFGIVDSGLQFNSASSADGATGGATLGLIEFSGNGSVDYSAGVNFDSALELVIDMPDLNLSLDGAACFASSKGSCESSVTNRQSGDFSVRKAEADYIVLDRSALNAVSAASVVLETGAQADARAVSLVNAAGGEVAVGTNIASGRGDEATLSLPLINVSQENRIMQKPGWAGGLLAPGGIIAAYESHAMLLGSASVELMDEAQRGVHALSVVNSAEATVANGVNIWAGNLATATFDDSLNVMQSNLAQQTSPESTARLIGYRRDAETLRSSYSNTTTKPATDTGDGFLPPGIPGQIYGEQSLIVGDVVTLERTGMVPTSIIPTSKIPGGKPGALAVAGQGDLHFDGGQVDLNATSSTTAWNATAAEVNGSADLFFGLVGGDANYTYYDSLDAGLTTELVFGVDLPDLTISVDGAICIAKSAECAAGTSERDFGALDLGPVAADNIVVDRSSLTSVEDYRVVLGGGAQADARALLMVNASGGNIANALNVARIQAAELATQPNLAQSNLMIQTVGSDGEPGPRAVLRANAGGTVVANESAASLASAAEVALGTEAQVGARALAMVNSADTLVANGINVWDGEMDMASIEYATNIMQSNQVLQSVAPGVARIDGYRRGTSQSRDVSVHTDSRTPQQFIKAAFEIEIDGFGSYSEGLSAPAAAIPTAKVPGTKGMVVGLAGDADVTYGGGSANLLFDIDSYYAYELAITSDGEISDFLGFGNTSGELEFGGPQSNGMPTAPLLSVNVSPTLTFEAEFATLDIEAEGAFCWANGGSCFAGIREQQEGRLCVGDMEAEYITTDHSTLSVNESYVVALDSGAQANVRALAIVNSAGGLVSNSINVANMSGTALDSPTINLVQRNVVVQRP